MSISPKELYNKYIGGDKITDNELKESIPFWRDLASMLNKAGPVFKLAANEAGRVHRGLEGFAEARAPRLQLEQSTSKFDITWKNTLNWENLLGNVKYNHISDFRLLALEGGYPHFAWSGRIYFTETGAFTGIFSDEI